MSPLQIHTATILYGFSTLDSAIQSGLLRFEQMHRKSVAPEGIYPQPVRIPGSRCVAWRADDIRSLIETASNRS